MANKALKQATKKAKGKVSAPKPKGIATKAPSKVAKPTSLRRNITAPVKAAAAKVPAEALIHRLDALLHTMRTIAQHEDELCTLLHDARRTGKVSSAVLRELQAVLAALPGHEYTDDLDAVLQMTATAA